MKHYIFYFLSLIFFVGCSTKNSKNIEKPVFIFDFDDTISITAVSMEVFYVASDYNNQKIAVIKEILHEKSKNHVGPISYLLLNEITNIIGRKITTNDFDIATQNIISKKITPGIEKTIKNIIKNGNEVFIIGGGYGTCEAILKVANHLGISQNNVFSGIRSFNKKNELELIKQKIGFFNCISEKKITDSFLKSKVVAYLKSIGLIKNKVIFIGDGKNDLEVWENKQADFFVGFGINKVDAKVKKNAPLFVENISDFNNYIKKTW